MESTGTGRVGSNRRDPASIMSARPTTLLIVVVATLVMLLSGLPVAVGNGVASVPSQAASRTLKDPAISSIPEPGRSAERKGSASVAGALASSVATSAHTRSESSPKLPGGRSEPVLTTAQLTSAAQSITTRRGSASAGVSPGSRAPASRARVSPGPLADPHPQSGPVTGNWTQLCSSCAPSSRAGAMMAYDVSDGYVVLYGGYTNTNPVTYLSDTWTYSDGQWTQLVIPAPPARAAGSLAWDAADHELVLFGGVNSAGVQLGDTWTFAGGSWAQDTGSTNNPPARMASMMTYDVADGYLVLYGGYTQATGGGGSYGGTGYFNDLWEFKGGQWTQLSAHGTSGVPPPMYGASMTFDAYDGYVVMFGGRENTGPTYMPYTWEYNGGDWYNISSATAPPVWNCGAILCQESIAYDALDKEVVYVTDTSGRTEVTWFFQSGTWTNVTATASAPPVGLDAAMGYDAGDGYVVDFSGLNLAAAAWIYPGIMGVTISASQPGVDVGQTLTLKAVVTGGTPPYSYSWPTLPNGCSSADQATITCQPSTAGSDSAVVEVTDGSGGRSVTSAAFSITVSPALTVATPIGSEPFSDVNEAVTFGTSTTGGPGTYLTYSWTEVPLGCVSVNSSTLPCTPSSPGTYPVLVSVTDGNHDTLASPSLPYEVMSNPSVTIAENRTVLDVGESITFWANASGGSGVYTYTYNNLPAGCSSANVSVLSCTPSATISSTYVTVSIVDTVGGTATSGKVFFGVDADPTLSLSWAEGGTPSYANASLDLLLTYGSGSPNYHPCLLAPGSNYPKIVCGIWQGGSTYAFGLRYSSAGSYSLTASIEDSTGWNTTSTLTVNVYWPLAVVTVSLPYLLDEGMTATGVVEIVHGAPGFSVWWNDTTSGSSLCVANPSGDGTSSCPFVADWLGTDTIEVTVRDSLSDSFFLNLTLIVNPDLHGFGLNASVGSFSGGQGGTLTDEVGATVHFIGTYQGGTAPFTTSWSFNGSVSMGSGTALSYSWAHGGTYLVTFTVSDVWDRTLSGEITVQVGPNASGLALDAHLARLDVGTPDNLTLNFSGGLAPFSYSWDFGDGSTATTDVPWVSHSWASAGPFTVRVTVTDGAGVQFAASATVESVAGPGVGSLSASSVSSTATAGGTLATYENASVDLSAMLQGGIGPYQLSWAANGTTLGRMEGSGPWFNVSYIWRTTGEFQLTFTVTDVEGHSASGSVEVVIRLDSIGLATLSSQRTPVDAGVPDNLTLSFKGGVGPFTFGWILGDGSGGYTSDPWIVHSWTTAGTFLVTVNVKDSLGAAASATLVVQVGQALVAPCAPAANSSVVWVGDPVSLDLGCVSNGTAPYSLSWLTGEGVIVSTTPEANMTYLQAGNYTIRVLVNDSGGGSVLSRALQIEVETVAGVTPTVQSVTYSLGSVTGNGTEKRVQVTLAATIFPGAGSLTSWRLAGGATQLSGLPWRPWGVMVAWANVTILNLTQYLTLQVQNSIGRTSAPFLVTLNLSSAFVHGPGGGGGSGLSLGEMFLLLAGLAVVALAAVVGTLYLVRKRKGRSPPPSGAGPGNDAVDPVSASIITQVRENPGAREGGLVLAVKTATGASEDAVRAKLAAFVSAGTILETFGDEERSYSLPSSIADPISPSARVPPAPDPVDEEARLNRIYDTLVDEVARRGDTRETDLQSTMVALGLDPAMLPTILGELVMGLGLLTCHSEGPGGEVVYSLSEKEERERASRSQRAAPALVADESAAGEVRPVVNGSADVRDLR